MNYSRLLATAVVAGAFPLIAQAVCEGRNYGFSATANNNGQVSSVTACADTAEELVDLFNRSSLKSLLPTYTDTATVFLDVNFASVPMQLSFQGSTTTLTFNAPEVGVTNMTFGGPGVASTRDESVKQLKHYLEETNFASEVMNHQVTHSPTSPLAGVNGLIPTVVATDFNGSFFTPYRSDNREGWDANIGGVGLEAGSGTTNGRNVKSYSLPLSFVWRSGTTPGQQFALNGTVTEVETAGAQFYHAGLGVSARLPVNDRWALQPAIGYAVTAAVDLNTVAGVYSASLASNYRIPMDAMDFTIGNMVGYYHTPRISIGEYSFDPEVKTFAVRNGVKLHQPIVAMGRSLALEYHFIDTRFTGGTKFYIDNTQEVGVSIGSNQRTVTGSSFRVGLRYQRARDSDSVSLLASYWF